jgi:anti-anti-sigma factor
MELNVTQEGKQARFEIKGDIDEPGAEKLKHLFQNMNAFCFEEVVFDFREVAYIGSSGIGKLLLFYKDLSLYGGRIRVENVSETVCELFNVLKLDTVFTISKTPDN